MYGFYQFKDNKYYNKPIGDREGLSIFPYIGHSYGPNHGRPIPIRLGRYSKSTLDGEVDLTSDSSHFKGPLPFIYNIQFSGITGQYPCNTPDCEALNNRTIPLYGVPYTPMDLSSYNFSVTGAWANTFTTREHPYSIYTNIGAEGTPPFSFRAGYDTVSLSYIEGKDVDIGKSYLILTLYNSLTPVFSYYYGNYDKLPLLFCKTFEKGEKIFALEEPVTLLPITHLDIEHGLIEPWETHLYIQELNLDNTHFCSQAGASVTLTPYQSGQFDIYNNHNCYAEIANDGRNHEVNISLPVTTSSGIMYVNKIAAAGSYVTDNSLRRQTPAYYNFTTGPVEETALERVGVPANLFFDQTFKLKPNNSQWHYDSTDRYYEWNNNIEADDVNTTFYKRNYVGLDSINRDDPYEAFPVNLAEPTLNNIRIYLYDNLIDLFFMDDNGFSYLNFRKTIGATDDLLTTTYTGFTLISDSTNLTDYFTFHPESFTLVPQSGQFITGLPRTQCQPFCNDGTSPISANIEVSLSGYFQVPYLGSSSFTYIRENINEHFNLIVDMDNTILENSTVTYLLNWDPSITWGSSNSIGRDKIVYGCNAGGEYTYGGGFLGTPISTQGLYSLSLASQYLTIPPISGQMVGNSYVFPNLPFTMRWNIDSIALTADSFYSNGAPAFFIGYNISHDTESGCPRNFDCSRPIGFGPNQLIRANPENVGIELTLTGPGGAIDYSYSISYSGVVTFNGFL